MLVISLFVVGSVSCILLLPAFPMVTIPNVCITEIDCVGYASLSCVIFGVGGLDFGSHYYLSAGGDCHLTVQQALSVMERLKVRKGYCTHIAHDLGHEETNAQLPPHVRLAYDGLQLDF
jgi:hypothetical protein